MRTNPKINRLNKERENNTRVNSRKTHVTKDEKTRIMLFNLLSCRICIKISENKLPKKNNNY